MVWRSQDPLLRRSVAVKLIHPRLADDPGFAQAFRDEARNVAVLSAPGVARLLDTGEQDGVVYIVREYAAGSSLRVRLDEGGPASPAETVRVGAAALHALAEAHERGVLHLALDADDVIIGDDGRVCLIDFGIGAAIAASRPQDAAELLGDEHLAPEQIAGEGTDARTDLYAVASLLFGSLTGEAPRGRTSARGIRPDVPRALDRVSAQCSTAIPNAASRAPAPSPMRSSVRSMPSSSTYPTEDGPRPCSPGSAFRSSSWGSPPPRSRSGYGWVSSRSAARSDWASPDEPASAEISPIPVLPATVDVLDPFGDGEELSSNAGLANDGDAQTAWRSENYFDGELGKPGIGLLLDLGDRSEVIGLRLWTPHPGFRFSVAIGDDPDALVDEVGDEVTSTSLSRVPLRGIGRTCWSGSPRSFRSTTASARRSVRCACWSRTRTPRRSVPTRPLGTRTSFAGTSRGTAPRSPHSSNDTSDACTTSPCA